jgi:hypothetical protein
MLLIYVDESGTGLGRGPSSHFVLTAFITDVAQSRILDQQIVHLKQKIAFWAKPEDFEIKGRDIRRGEGVFRSVDFAARLQIMSDIAELLSKQTFTILAVLVDKRALPSGIGSDEDLYRIAFWRLLEGIEDELENRDEQGMLFLDARSDQHSSVQDRRTVDSYRGWLALRQNETRLIELPWFGFSEFYAGLQIADFCAYTVNCLAREENVGRDAELYRSLEALYSRIQVMKVP